ncbi:hypothetical protein OS122_02580 [Mycolicibacterium mucogenicum]|uniref:hypothetical protein n=1 Tax=Mycolicibacterium mucogenicum TaxID=56689 RepID=UPI0022698678|nr:hypothetical protein [Mycolicibacterium mucogenicum]MCX8559785.1 hypothetical protein [Mycolicibacterium mucogenicum]
MVAGREASPADIVATHRLFNYWAHGAGAAKIGWGTDGDFDRCIANVQAAVTDGGKPPLSDSTVKGLCANLHHAATGAWPGHAPGESTPRT